MKGLFQKAGNQTVCISHGVLSDMTQLDCSEATFVPHACLWCKRWLPKPQNRVGQFLEFTARITCKVVEFSFLEFTTSSVVSSHFQPHSRKIDLRIRENTGTYIVCVCVCLFLHLHNWFLMASTVVSSARKDNKEAPELSAWYLKVNFFAFRLYWHLQSTNANVQYLCLYCMYYSTEIITERQTKSNRNPAM